MNQGGCSSNKTQTQVRYACNSTTSYMKALYSRVHTPVSRGGGWGGWGGGHSLLLCPPGLSTKQQENCHFCPFPPFLHLFPPSHLKAIVIILSKSQFSINFNKISMSMPHELSSRLQLFLTLKSCHKFSTLSPVPG